MAKRAKPKQLTPAPYSPPTTWDFPDVQHRLNIGYDGSTFEVLLQQLSYAELNAAQVAGSDAIGALLDAAIMNKHEIPAQYIPLVADEVADFFSRPRRRDATAGATDSDAEPTETSPAG